MSDRLQVGILGLFFDETADSAIVLLGEGGLEQRVLPIVIGPAEAQALAIGLSDIETPRPLTHDLMLRAIEAAGGHVRGVDVVALDGGTFLAELEITSRVGTARLDARPSDCMVIAVRADIPIHVDRDLFERACVGVVDAGADALDEEQIDRIMREFRDFLDRAGPEDFDLGPGPHGADPEDT